MGSWGPFLERPDNLSGPKSNSWNYDALAGKAVWDIRKDKITDKFQSLKRLLIEETKGFMSPEKFRDVQETGPWRYLLWDFLFLRYFYPRKRFGTHLHFRKRTLPCWFFSLSNIRLSWKGTIHFKVRLAHRCYLPKDSVPNRGASWGSISSFFLLNLPRYIITCVFI